MVKRMLGMALGAAAALICACAVQAKEPTPYKRCVPKAVEPPPKPQHPLRSHLWLQPLAGYYDYDETYTVTTRGLLLPRLGVLIPCDQLPLQRITCLADYSQPTSGESVGLALGGDLSWYGVIARWRLDYADTFTGSDSQNRFASTAFEASLGYRVWARGDGGLEVFGGYRRRLKGEGAFSASLYAESGPQFGLRYEGLPITGRWSVDASAAYYLPDYVIPLESTQYFRVAPTQYAGLYELRGLQDLRPGGNGFRVDLQVHAPDPHHSFGVELQSVSVDAVTQPFVAYANFNTRQFVFPSQLDVSFSELSINAFYRYTFRLK